MHSKGLLEAQKKAREAGALQSVEARQQAILSLQKSVLVFEKEILSALAKDLGKERQEAYLSELLSVVLEAKQLCKLTKHTQRKVLLEPYLWPSHGRIANEPYGSVLVLSPWNYPVYLTLMPLLGALAGGNTVVARPSRKTPHTAKVLAKVVEHALPAHIATVLVDADPEALLQEPFDYVFFTGSRRVGRRVAARCGAFLRPYTLELGGKSPVFVTARASIDQAAKRIAFAKVLNAGQTCVAPDYVLCDKSVAKALLAALANAFEDLLPHGVQSEGYAKIIDQTALTRLKTLRDENATLRVFGGKVAKDRMAPALFYPVCAKDSLMQDEIFGPLLPILPYEDLANAIAYVNAHHPNPLALYVFSKDRQEQKKILTTVPSGGAAINDCLLQLSTNKLPFGGRGASGVGAYHGKASIETFSHQKSIFYRTPLWPHRMVYEHLWGKQQTELPEKIFQALTSKERSDLQE